MNRRVRIILITILALVISISFIFYLLSYSVKSVVSPTNTKILKISSFNAKGTDGREYSKDNLLKQKSMIFFGYTYCPIVCPTTNYKIAKIVADLGRRTKNLDVYFITIDPSRDTVVRLKKYLKSFNSKIIGVVPESSDDLKSIAKSFSIFYEKVKEGDSYSMNHTSSIFLVKKDGTLYTKISYLENYENSLEDVIDFLDD